MASDLVINIASQFLGKRAFGDADKATKKLSSSVKSLGKVLGVSLSAGAVLAYGKAAVKAASQDIKAQNLLANSLKNVGLAYATVDVEAFIGNMQKQTGILDDQLRPAFSKLASVTGSVAKTQKIMSLAFDVSSGSGLDYSSTVDILAQAYVGNTKGLKQLNLGLTKAEIAAMSFDDVMQLMSQRFAGSGATAIDTFVGQMQILGASASTASEIIGTSLLGAIDSLAGSDGIGALATDIENAAKSMGNFINSIVYLKEQIATIPGAGIVSGAFGVVGNILGRFSPQKAAELLKQIKGPQPFSQPMTIANQDTGRADIAAKRAAELDAIKRNKELAKLAKQQAASQAKILADKKSQAILDKANLALNKGTNVFNLDAIQVEAAMANQTKQLGAVTSAAQLLAITNDIARLKIKQDILDLEAAIASKNDEAIKAATARLNTDLALLGQLQNQKIKLVEIKDILAALKPKDLISLENLDKAIAKLKEIAGGFAGSTTPTGTPVVTPVVPTAPSVINAQDYIDFANGMRALANKEETLKKLLLTNTDTSTVSGASLVEGLRAGLSVADASAGSRYAGQYAAYMASQGTPITITIVDKTSGLIEVVQEAVIENNRYGNNLTFAGAIG